MQGFWLPSFDARRANRFQRMRRPEMSWCATMAASSGAQVLLEAQQAAPEQALNILLQRLQRADRRMGSSHRLSALLAFRFVPALRATVSPVVRQAAIERHGGP